MVIQVSILHVKTHIGPCSGLHDVFASYMEFV